MEVEITKVGISGSEAKRDLLFRLGRCDGAPSLCVNDNWTGFVPTGKHPNGGLLTPVAGDGTVLTAFGKAASAALGRRAGRLAVVRC